MPVPMENDCCSKRLGIIGDWWRNWIGRLLPDRAGGYDRARISRRAYPGTSELRTIAGKWPNAEQLLSQRLVVLQIYCEPSARGRAANSQANVS